MFFVAIISYNIIIYKKLRKLLGQPDINYITLLCDGTMCIDSVTSCQRNSEEVENFNNHLVLLKEEKNVSYIHH